jgi:hypothetical protein
MGTAPLNFIILVVAVFVSVSWLQWWGRVVLAVSVGVLLRVSSPISSGTSTPGSRPALLGARLALLGARIALLGAHLALLGFPVWLLIPQVRLAQKYPIPPWEMIHPPGEDNPVCI